MLGSVHLICKFSTGRCFINSIFPLTLVLADRLSRGSPIPTRVHRGESHDGFCREPASLGVQRRSGCRHHALCARARTRALPAQLRSLGLPTFAVRSSCARGDLVRAGRLGSGHRQSCRISGKIPARCFDRSGRAALGALSMSFPPLILEFASGQIRTAAAIYKSTVAISKSSTRTDGSWCVGWTFQAPQGGVKTGCLAEE